MTEHTCAVCGHGADLGSYRIPPTTSPVDRAALEAAGGSTRGCLVLYETSDGGEAWVHRTCAERAR